MGGAQATGRERRTIGFTTNQQLAVEAADGLAILLDVLYTEWGKLR